MKKRFKKLPSLSWRNLGIAGGILALVLLLTYRLGTLTNGISPAELNGINAQLGWHGIYANPLYLPIQFLRSVLFVIFASHGALIDRLPEVSFGFLTIISFAWLMKLWHDTRTAILATILFATSAWVLHVSRFASFDVLYLWLLPSLLLTHVLLHKYNDRQFVVYGSLFIWGLMLLIPGGVWFVLANAILQREDIATAFKNNNRWWQVIISVFCFAIWLPLIALVLSGHGGYRAFLGLPAIFLQPFAQAKELVAVPMHLFIMGPKYPDIWLGSAPILSIFTLVMCLAGIYYYADHWRAGRSKLLATMFVLGIIFVGLAGPVGLSVLVPLLYVFVAMGLAFLLKQWLNVFPLNPLARSVGIGLIVIAVALTSVYSLKSYFVAWPHEATTQRIFRIHP